MKRFALAVMSLLLCAAITATAFADTIESGVRNALLVLSTGPANVQYTPGKPTELYRIDCIFATPPSETFLMQVGILTTEGATVILASESVDADTSFYAYQPLVPVFMKPTDKLIVGASTISGTFGVRAVFGHVDKAAEMVNIPPDPEGEGEGGGEGA